LTSGVVDLRADGRLGLLGRVLMGLAWNAFNLGRFDLAATAADEAVRLAADSGQSLVRAMALVVQSAVSALRDGEDVEERLAEAARLGLQVESSGALAVVQLARGVVALNQGRHEEAWDALVRVSDPSRHPLVHSLTVADLVEAAIQSGHRAEVEPLVAGLESIALRTPSPALHVGLRYARALLAPEDEAEALFAAALAADLSSWPFARARLQLAHGAWLRRQRRAAESRAPLRAARDTFDALGAVAWGDRARQELRASGEQSRPRTPEAREQLSPQELLIAQLAAEGLTNREIGARLYLSHRTVGTHLHRIFPKLGITSRVALQAAIGPTG
jgi:ATP/maltotriose-dependent transcriptional regulator MalT